MHDVAIEASHSGIRAWRTRMRLDRKQAAESLGVSVASYKSYETATRAVPLYIAKLAGLTEQASSGTVGTRPTLSDIHVIGGGTFSRVRHHFSLCAEAFGTTAEEIVAGCEARGRPAVLHLTRMADRSSSMVTSQDVGDLIDRLVADKAVRVLFMNAALADFDGQVGDVISGK